jgi:hypothetical protein
MESGVSTDRATIRAMVEDFWRSFLSVAQQTSGISTEIILQFNERMQATAAAMEPEKAAMFLQIVEEEREILFNEYEKNPDALKTRLGLQPPTIQRDVPQSLDPESIRAVAQSDYQVVRKMASAPGATIAGTGAQIDAEIARRLREHVAGMSATDAATFTQIYNAEYNRLAMARLQETTGCVVPFVIGATIALSILASCTVLAATLLR